MITVPARVSKSMQTTADIASTVTDIVVLRLLLMIENSFLITHPPYSQTNIIAYFKTLCQPTRDQSSSVCCESSSTSSNTAPVDGNESRRYLLSFDKGAFCGEYIAADITR